MRKMNLIVPVLFVLLSACGEKNNPNSDAPGQGADVKWTISPATIALAPNGETKSVIVDANGEWTVKSISVSITTERITNILGLSTRRST